MQLAKLDYALGGVIIYNSFPLPPLFDMPKNDHTFEEAKKNATYYGQDMRFMICYGEDDPIFPPPITQKAYHDIFDVLQIRDTLKVDHIEPNFGHYYTQTEFETMVDFLNFAEDQGKTKKAVYWILGGLLVVAVGLSVFIYCKCCKKDEKTFKLGTLEKETDTTPLDPQSA